MKDKIKLSSFFPVPAEEIYNAWLNSKSHSEFTGTTSTVSSVIGGEFNAGNGYISGKNLELHPNQKIVQAWRTTEFPEGSPDSLLEILFEETSEGTNVTIIHSDIPEGQIEMYENGWKEYYFKPMKEYFK